MSDQDVDEYAAGAIACMVLDLCVDAKDRNRGDTDAD
jgi:hypothetical protein